MCRDVAIGPLISSPYPIVWSRLKAQTRFPPQPTLCLESSSGGLLESLWQLWSLHFAVTWRWDVHTYLTSLLCHFFVFFPQASLSVCKPGTVPETLDKLFETDQPIYGTYYWYIRHKVCMTLHWGNLKEILKFTCTIKFIHTGPVPFGIQRGKTYQECLEI